MKRCIRQRGAYIYHLGALIMVTQRVDTVHPDGMIRTGEIADSDQPGSISGDSLCGRHLSSPCAANRSWRSDVTTRHLTGKKLRSDYLRIALPVHRVVARQVTHPEEYKFAFIVQAPEAACNDVVWYCAIWNLSLSNWLRRVRFPVGL